jgi:branched-chain amino acid transport system substrate-binding protein
MSKLGLTTSLCVALTFAITNASSSRAQISNDVVKIGVMADMNGPLSTAGGRGSVEAARIWRHCTWMRVASPRPNHSTSSR